MEDKDLQKGGSLGRSILKKGSLRRRIFKKGCHWGERSSKRGIFFGRYKYPKCRVCLRRIHGDKNGHEIVFVPVFHK